MFTSIYKTTLSHCCMWRKPAEEFKMRLIIIDRSLYWLSLCKTVSSSSHVSTNMYKTNIITLLHVMQANRPVQNQTHHHIQTTSLIVTMQNSIQLRSRVFILCRRLWFCFFLYFRLNCHHSSIKCMVYRQTDLVIPNMYLWDSCRAFNTVFWHIIQLVLITIP